METNHCEVMQQYEQRLISIHDLVESKDLLVVVDSQAGEVERLKAKLAEFAKLSEVWESDRLSKNDEIEELKEQLIGFDGWRKETKINEEKQKLLEDEIEMEKKLRNDR